MCFFQFQDAQESLPQYVDTYTFAYIIILYGNAFFYFRDSVYLCKCVYVKCKFLLQTYFYGFGYSDNGCKKGNSLFLQQWLRSGEENFRTMGRQQHVPFSGDERIRIFRSNSYIWTSTDHFLRSFSYAFFYLLDLQ